MFYKKTILLQNLYAVNQLLNDNEIISIYLPCCIFNNRVAIKHHAHDNMNIIRIWNIPSYFDYLYTDFPDSDRIIGALDYSIHSDYIKIDYLFVNDDKITSDDVLEKDDADELINSLLNFVKILAKNQNKNKIVMDVHKNLRLFNKYYKDKDIVSTNNKCIYNPYWIETNVTMER